MNTESFCSSDGREDPPAKLRKMRACTMSLLRSLATNMAAIVSGKAMTAVAGLATMVVLTRHLGPTEFGYYRTVLTYCAFAAVLADCGLYMINLREISRPGAIWPSRRKRFSAAFPQHRQCVAGRCGAGLGYAL